jgi:hypothetical protein
MLNEHGGDNEQLRGMIEALETTAGQPPKEREGVPDSFLADLDRVPKSKLKKGDKCPICSEPFLDGELTSLGPINSFISETLYNQRDLYPHEKNAN